MKKFIALLLALCMVACLFAGCKEEEATTPSSDASTTASTPEASTDNGSNESTPLVVGYLPFSEKFSPFYADTGYDQDVVSMVSLGIMTTDRTGAIVYNARRSPTMARTILTPARPTSPSTMTRRATPLLTTSRSVMTSSSPTASP